MNEQAIVSGGGVASPTPSKKNRMPWWAWILIGIVVIAAGYLTYMGLTKEEDHSAHSVPEATVAKIHDCVNNGMAEITHAARTDEEYAKDTERIARESADLTLACHKQYGVNEVLPKAETQSHKSHGL